MVLQMSREELERRQARTTFAVRRNGALWSVECSSVADRPHLLRPSSEIQPQGLKLLGRYTTYHLRRGLFRPRASEYLSQIPVAWLGEMLVIEPSVGTMGKIGRMDLAVMTLWKRH